MVMSPDTNLGCVMMSRRTGILWFTPVCVNAENILYKVICNSTLESTLHKDISLIGT